MIYEPNTTQWHISDLVIHDADAKRTEMLMVVVGYDRRTGTCITRYRNPGSLSDDFPGKKQYTNNISTLDDPKRFGITEAIMGNVRENPALLK